MSTWATYLNIASRYGHGFLDGDCVSAAEAAVPLPVATTVLSVSAVSSVSEEEAMATLSSVDVERRQTVNYVVFL